MGHRFGTKQFKFWKSQLLEKHFIIVILYCTYHISEPILSSVALCSKAVSIKLKERFGVSATFPHVVSRHTHIVLQWWSPARIFRSIYPVYCRWYQDFLIFTDGMSWRWRPICLIALWANLKVCTKMPFTITKILAING